MTAPLPLPDYNLVRGTIRLVDPVASSASHSGAKLNMTQVVDPAWIFEAETMPLWDDERRPWTAWKNSLRGGLRMFIAHDVTRRPLAYPGAQASTDIAAGWDGTATVTDVGLSGALAMSGLPAAYQASVGDRFGIENASGSFGYYEATEDVSASGAGDMAITLTPFLHRSLFQAGDTVRLWQPLCKFILDWQSWSEDTRGGPTPVSFTAYQRVM
ncbi:hypothetical protein [uncultured Nitratireductor sp.]|uniref:hypothetical protein n=1 Tax=uncultured Nitratireductor sp. TaxID=520953 RepID=UPI002607E752|nr:hypothetical protein [uncultured Nitratireductor sp.]